MHRKQNIVSPRTQAMLNIHHSPNLISLNQCGSSLVQTINAPLPLVWSLIRRFECPQGYKQFVKECTMLAGDGGIGSIREVIIMTGLPARFSVERLDNLDDDSHVLTFSIIGGDHRLVNYRSTVTLHEEEEEESYGRKTVAIESYVVDIPAGNSGEDTCFFANTIIGWNLRSLAKIAEEMTGERSCLSCTIQKVVQPCTILVNQSESSMWISKFDLLKLDSLYVTFALETWHKVLSKLYHPKSGTTMHYTSRPIRIFHVD